jgi:hypothetical protein
LKPGMVGNSSASFAWDTTLGLDADDPDEPAEAAALPVSAAESLDVPPQATPATARQRLTNNRVDFMTGIRGDNPVVINPVLSSRRCELHH